MGCHAVTRLTTMEMMRLNRKTSLDAALQYAALNWPVYPVRGQFLGGIPLDDTGGKEGMGSTDPAQIRQWFERWPDANVGIKTGGVSALVVVNVGGDKGRTDLAAIQERYGQLPDTL